MLAARNLLVRSARASAGKCVAPSFMSQRHMATLADKERGEEARYIHAIEEERRLKYEKLAAHEKKEVDKLIEHHSQPEKKMTFGSFISQWNYALPAGILALIPLCAHDIVVLDPEVHLFACTVMIMAAIHNEAGTAIGNLFDGEADAVMADMKLIDEAAVAEAVACKALNESVLDTEELANTVFAVQDDMSTVLAESLNFQEQHKFNEMIRKKVENLAALEEVAVTTIKGRMISEVQSSVVNSFTNDKKAKDSALASALAAISGGAKNMGKDVVGDYYASSLKSYKDAYAKQAAGSDPVLVQLQKDVDAIVADVSSAAPTTSNVYESHPLFGGAK